MIWAFEYLNEKQLNELKSRDPFLDFRYDDGTQTFYWQTFCAGYNKIYSGQKDFPYGDTFKYYEIPVDRIDYYPNEKECVDNAPSVLDSYEYIIEKIRSGQFKISHVDGIRVTPNKDRFYTIDKSRLRAFKEAEKLGFKGFSTIPCRIVDELNQEIRRIKLFPVKNTRQGFISDDFNEAMTLSAYMQGASWAKENIEKEYKWITDYLCLRKDNLWMDTIAIPLKIYLDHYSDDSEALEMIDLKSIMGK